MIYADNITDGDADVWSIRWCSCGKPFKYTVRVIVRGFSSQTFDAVIDDFGNLVKVDK